jgi:hypothetical protein
MRTQEIVGLPHISVMPLADSGRTGHTIDRCCRLISKSLIQAMQCHAQAAPAQIVDERAQAPGIAAFAGMLDCARALDSAG